MGTPNHALTAPCIVGQDTELAPSLRRNTFTIALHLDPLTLTLETLVEDSDQQYSCPNQAQLLRVTLVVAGVLHSLYNVSGSLQDSAPCCS